MTPRIFEIFDVGTLLNGFFVLFSVSWIDINSIDLSQNCMWLDKMDYTPRALRPAGQYSKIEPSLLSRPSSFSLIGQQVFTNLQKYNCPVASGSNRVG